MSRRCVGLHCGQLLYIYYDNRAINSFLSKSDVFYQSTILDRSNIYKGIIGELSPVLFTYGSYPILLVPDYVVNSLPSPCFTDDGVGWSAVKEYDPSSTEIIGVVNAISNAIYLNGNNAYIFAPKVNEYSVILYLAPARPYQMTIFVGGTNTTNSQFAFGIYAPGQVGGNYPANNTYGVYHWFYANDVAMPYNSVAQGNHVIGVSWQGNNQVYVTVDGQTSGGYVWNGSSWSSYVSSQPFTLPSTPSPQYTTTYIGGNGLTIWGYGLGYFHGLIYAAYVYNTPLSLSQIQQLTTDITNLRPASIRTGLVIELLPNNISGQIWTDSSGNNNNGNIVNGIFVPKGTVILTIQNSSSTPSYGSIYKSVNIPSPKYALIKFRASQNSSSSSLAFQITYTTTSGVQRTVVYYLVASSYMPFSGSYTFSVSTNQIGVDTYALIQLPPDILSITQLGYRASVANTTDSHIIYSTQFFC